MGPRISSVAPTSRESRYLAVATIGSATTVSARHGGPVDPETVDQNYAQLQQQAQQTATQIQTLASKLQTAAAAGDPNAREWMLDLKEITLGVQQEQGQVSLLLQSIHSMVSNHVETMAQPQYQQPGYQQPQYQPPQYQQPG